MAYYYKINEPEDFLPLQKGFCHQKAKKYRKPLEPTINYDFSKHVLVELLDDVTPEKQLWEELGLNGNKNVLHKRMMIDSHRIKCRRAIVICITSDEAKRLAQDLSQKKVMKRFICAVVIEDLLSDLCLFEKQIKQFGDKRPQQQLLYVSDLNRCREPAGLVRFLKEKFTQFGTILSVLVCADDDGYAFPEGVIKFAFLSEAFAAELAFDQYVVGKERLSVTSHHNILLSQCDLRVRLRAAQCSNNAELSIMQASPFYSSYDLNSISLHSNNQFFNSTDTLQIIPQEYNIDKDTNISANINMLDISYSKTKLFNSKLNTLLNKMNKLETNCFENTDFQSNCISSDDKKLDDSAFMSNNNSLHKNMINSSTTVSKNTTVLNNLIEDTHERKRTEISDGEISFHCSSQIEPGNDMNPATFQQYNVKKCLENESNSGSYYTCRHEDQDYLSFNSESNLSPSKTIVSSVSHSKSNILTQEQSASSKFSAVPSTSKGTKAKVSGKVSPKYGNKRKKHFVPSQKLCLKSQRIALSQSDSQNANPSTVSKNFPLSQSNQLLETNLESTRVLSIDSLNNLPSDLSIPTKVNSWLSDLPSSETEKCLDLDSKFVDRNALNDNFCASTSQIISVYPKQELNEQNAFKIPRDISDSCFSRLSVENKINTYNQEFRLSTNKHMRRISVHLAPSLKSENYLDVGLHSDESSTENKDPNEMSAMISQKSIVLEKQDSTTPLQSWLKQELFFSTNNNVATSLDTAKSIIVCAAKTRDIIISVGCSHITCETCYPESTTLLLGYS